MVTNCTDSEPPLSIIYLSGRQTLNVNNEIYRKSRSMIKTINIFENDSKCIDHICKNDNEIFIAILPDSDNYSVIQRINSLSQVRAIYVYNCNTIDCNRNKLKNYEKVKAIVLDPNELIFRMQTNYRRLETSTESPPLIFISKTSTELNGEFVSWCMIFKNLAHETTDSVVNLRITFIDQLKTICQGNETWLGYIEDLNRDYQAKDALRWYTKHIFVYKALNQALRSRDLKALLHFRGFIADMCRCIEILHKEQQQQQRTDSIPIAYYRCQHIHVRELEQIRKNKYLSINSFFSTSSDSGVAEFFLDPIDRNELKSVLFRVNVNTNVKEAQAFADIEALSQFPDEKETLFIPGTIFLIHSVTEPQDGGETFGPSYYWTVDLELCNTHPKELNDTYEFFDTTATCTTMSTLSRLAGFSRHIGRYEIAHTCYETLFQQTGKDCTDGIYGMALTACDMGDYEKAIELSDLGHQMYSILYKEKPPEIFWQVHYGWGLALLKKKGAKSLHLALEQLEKALCYIPEPSMCDDKFRKYHCHDSYAQVYGALGSVYREMQEYSVSMEKYDEALRHCSELPDDYQYKYYIYTHLGKTFRATKEYSRAIDYHTQALNFIEKEFSFGHYELARVHRALGLDYLEMGHNKQALKHLKEAFTLYDKMEWMDSLPARKQKFVKEIEHIQNIQDMPTSHPPSLIMGAKKIFSIIVIGMASLAFVAFLQSLST